MTYVLVKNLNFKISWRT